MYIEEGFEKGSFGFERFCSKSMSLWSDGLNDSYTPSSPFQNDTDDSMKRRVSSVAIVSGLKSQFKYNWIRCC